MDVSEDGAAIDDLIRAVKNAIKDGGNLQRRR